MAAKPVVLPNTYDSSSSWDDWICHFENVADVNDCDNEKKLKFLVGRAQRVFQHLSGGSRGSYEAAKDALKSRFEPNSKKSRYQSEFQCRRKRKDESWPDFTEDLRLLTDKAYIREVSKHDGQLIVLLLLKFLLLTLLTFQFYLPFQYTPDS